MSERFEQGMNKAKAIHDVRVVGGFIGIWCDGHHRDRERRGARTEAAALGVYGRRVPVLCEECEAHLAYAEKRRAFCPHDPKPFCAHCETHCYRPEESEWQRTVMRYAGPRSWYRGYLLDGIRHMREGRAFRREMAARAKSSAASEKE